jgi:hypothetical protein
MLDSTTLLPLAVLALVSVGFYAWGVWVSRRQRAAMYRFAPRGLLVGTVLALGGVALALSRVQSANVAARAADPAVAARQLADGTSSAIALATVPVGLGSVVWLVCAVIVLVGTIRSPPSSP